jgi:hypothetical protein
MRQSEEKIIEGKVKRYSRQGVGSFRNALIEGYNDFVTLGLGEGHRHPEVGERIRVTGVMLDGRFLTSSWERVA